MLERLHIAADVVGQLFLDEPQGQLYDALTNPELLHSWPLEDEDSRAATALLLAAKPDSIAELQRDHLYLFIGVSAPLAQPYESPYFSKDGLVMDDPTGEVSAFYQRVGFDPGVDNLPPDHIGFEFRCISYLSKLILEQRLSPAVLRQFVAEHPGRFAPQVLTAVDQHARTAIYRALPGLARGVLGAAGAL